MSEEEKMDKKTNPRQSSAIQKQNGNDIASKGQRSGGKRRGNGATVTNYSNNDGQPRKQTPQKFKNSWDKRPRSRGDFSDRTRGDLEEDMAAEFGSAIQSGSKKANLNHLLNFTYNDDHDASSRHRGGAGGTGAYSRGRQVRYRNSYSRYSKVCYNKEMFLQANCQFVVKADGDYSVHLMDPDILVNWEAVEQVRVIGQEDPSCPICLQYPTAAKMTRCGHIYCWACILHYLALEDQTWRKCPICYESIHSNDLKSVVSRKVKNYKVGDTITMTLMKKEKGSIYAVPANLWQKQQGKCHSILESDEMTRHVKLLTAKAAQVLEVVEVEKQELRVQLRESEASEEPFIKGAQMQVKAREDLLLGNKKVQKEIEQIEDVSKQVQSAPEQHVSSVKHTTNAKKIKQYKSAFSDEEDETVEENVDEDKVETIIPTENTASDVSPQQQTDDGSSSPIPVPAQQQTSKETTASIIDPAKMGSPVGPPEAQAPPIEMIPNIMPLEEAAEHLELPSQQGPADKTRHKSGDNCFYFYQAHDGQHIYLHSLNARCLVREYGSLEYCPQKITGTIIEKEGVFVTEELRKRLRYLSHLPLTCGFDVAELALKPPLIGKDTLKYFADNIEKRRRQRQRKARDDKRMARMIEEEERKQFGITGCTIVQSDFHRPPHTQRSSAHSQPSSGRVERHSDTRSDTSSPSLDTPIGSPSGLNVNAEEFQPGGSPGAEDDGQTATVSFAQMLKAGSQAKVWPKAKSDMVTSPVSPGSRPLGSDDSDNNEDKVPVPVFQHSFGDAVGAALQNIASKKTETVCEKTAPSGGSGKKKKKQLVLFSTSMARGGK